ncbi:hypothetical protein CCR75_006403 [Bremia lactucae]|uniref:Leucyl/phenylalanyl-tRNA--protein transferase n=1 Tax=Bremia lactucae TaxID=4779 RepID=A0A976IKC6_BRELC|nr:hypothetical protein CCR75_006403 [Bremia lactucae]
MTRSDPDYVPPHLRRYVFHSQDDFYVSRHFDPMLLSDLMYEGFLPIASKYMGSSILIPKLHRQRCVLIFQPSAPEHVPKIVRKRAKNYQLVLNRDFDGVVAGCHEKHGIPWLYPPIVQGFKALFQTRENGKTLNGMSKIRFYTVELYDVATNTLVAGELGYTVGSVYTSLTGFSRASGAGTVQLHALSKLLYLAGFRMWDLGMSMDYKMSLGAKDLDRDSFLTQLYKWRPEHILMKLDETNHEGNVRTGVLVKALLDNTRGPFQVPAVITRSIRLADNANQDASGEEKHQDDSIRREATLF